MYLPNVYPLPLRALAPRRPSGSLALLPECDSVVRNNFEEADVALRRDAPPARTDRPVFSLFSLFPDSTLLWQDDLQKLIAVLVSPERPRRRHRSHGWTSSPGRLEWPKTESVTLRISSGSPARSPESPRVAPPAAAAPRAGAPPTHHPATHAYVSVIYARSARSRGHAPARPLPARDDRQVCAKHTCCQRPRPSSFPRTIGRIPGEEDLIQTGDVGHIWVAEERVGI